jgi:hypothetical protein
VNAFDRSIAEWCGQSGLHPAKLHAFIEQGVACNDLLKGGLLVAALWWLWLQPHSEQTRRRELVVVAIAASLLGAILSRTIAQELPFRDRPFATPGLSIPIPLSSAFEAKGGSFPSDHLTLAFALVTGVFLASRPVGLALGAYTLVMVAGPRIYLGIHWATDIIGGVLLGIALVAAFNRPALREPMTRRVFSWMHRKPGLFYASLFLVSFGLMTRFDNVRTLSKYGVHAIQRSLGAR